MDIGLPDHDGFWVAKTIHQRQKRNHELLSIIVVLSAHTGEKEKQQFLKAGIVKVFSKPLDAPKTQEILALIDCFLL